jgi:phenylacetate-CoA ligase
MHQTYVSVHHLLKQNIPGLVDYLQKRKVVYYGGYPSGVYLLASYLVKNNITLRYPPKVTLTGSETLLAYQKETIEKAFDCEVFQFYGASEYCAAVSECENHSLHVDFEYGYVELLPLNNKPSCPRKMVCTGFINPVMPLIRYDIGDLATVSERICECGRQADIVERIDGRIESYIITPDGRQIGRLDFLFKKSDRIEEAQLIQDAHDHLTVKIVRSDNYSLKEEKSLLDEMRRYLGNEIAIDFDYVKEIPRTSNGKFRQIISMLPN